MTHNLQIGTTDIIVIANTILIIIITIITAIDVHHLEETLDTEFKSQTLVVEYTTPLPVSRNSSESESIRVEDVIEMIHALAIIDTNHNQPSES